MKKRSLICFAELEFKKETTILVNSEELHCHYIESGLNYYFDIELNRESDFLGIHDREYGKQKPNIEPVTSLHSIHSDRMTARELNLETTENDFRPDINSYPKSFTKILAYRQA